MSGRVASTGASIFLPDRLADRTLEGPIAVAEVLDLGRGRWLLVLQVAEALLASAVVEEGEGFRRASVGDGVAETLVAPDGGRPGARQLLVPAAR